MSLVSLVILLSLVTSVDAYLLHETLSIIKPRNYKSKVLHLLTNIYIPRLFCSLLCVLQTTLITVYIGRRGRWW